MSADPQPLRDLVLVELPYLRRYARALAGTQRRGDSFVAATLRQISDRPGSFPGGDSMRVALYRRFQQIWGESVPASNDAGRFDPSILPGATGPEERARLRLAALDPAPRHALLLTALEGFTHAEAGRILDVPAQRVAFLAQQALDALDAQTRTDVLVIEDEPLIALDIAAIVESLGHRVVETVDTAESAIQAFARHQPGLVLADVMLADGSTGIEAVTTILSQVSVPVIFITAYPHKLLTGERPEPTFLVPKPFTANALKAAVSQALFFTSASAEPHSA